MSGASTESTLGVLVATYGGGVFVMDPTTGARKDLAIDARGLTYAIPFGPRALVLGGTTGEIRRITGDGTVSVVGKAVPAKKGRPWTSPDGCGVDRERTVCGGSRSTRMLRCASPASGRR